jgi:hypothetical protein
LETSIVFWWDDLLTYRYLRRKRTPTR